MAGEMVQRGVDAAQVWPIQQNTENDLAGREGEAGLTIAGEAFRLMAEVLPGTRLTHHTVWDTGAAWVYEGGTATHVYIASRSAAPETIRLDRRDLDLEGQLWWKTTLGSTGAPADETARPVLEVRGDTDAGTRHLAFALEPYELVRATFYDAPLPNAPGGGFPHVMTGGGYADTIVASDLGNRVEGRGGADTLSGGRGRDEIRAGPGDDRAAGHQGADTLEGGGGADTLLGGHGGDVILGGAGPDHAEGGAGADLLVGGGGSDLLLGQGGADTLWGGAGADRLEGGAGDDVYVFTAGGGPDAASGLPAGWDDGLWG
jgi:Ca2+-binding RTX toxin-like protein